MYNYDRAILKLVFVKFLPLFIDIYNPIIKLTFKIEYDITFDIECYKLIGSILSVLNFVKYFTIP